MEYSSRKQTAPLRQHVTYENSKQKQWLPLVFLFHQVGSTAPAARNNPIAFCRRSLTRIDILLSTRMHRNLAFSGATIRRSLPAERGRNQNLYTRTSCKPATCWKVRPGWGSKEQHFDSPEIIHARGNFSLCFSVRSTQSVDPLAPGVVCKVVQTQEMGPGWSTVGT